MLKADKWCKGKREISSNLNKKTGFVFKRSKGESQKINRLGMNRPMRKDV